jgi:predicted HTH domain antitoxin
MIGWRINPLNAARNKGRLMLAVERYKKNEISLGKAAELAGVTLSDMINVLAEYV